MRLLLFTLIVFAQACSNEEVREDVAVETMEDTAAPPETMEDTAAPPETMEDTASPPETIQDTIVDTAVLADIIDSVDTAPADTLVPDLASCGTGVTRRVQSLSGGGNVDTRALAVHPDGAVTVGATLGNAHTFGAGTTAQVSFNAGLSSFALLHYNADGAFAWVKRFGRRHGYAHTLGRASDGSLVVAGSFQGPLVIDPGLPSEQSLNGPGDPEGYDLFVARVSASGQLLWVRVAGGDANDLPFAMAVAPDGSSFIAGRFADLFADSITFDAQHTLTAPSDGGESLFIVAYDPAGAVRWVRQVSSPSRDDLATGMTRLPDGSIVIAGTVGDGDALFEGGARPDGTLTYGDDGIYLARYSAAGDLLWLEGASGPSDTSSFANGIASNGNTIAMLVKADAGITLDAGQPSARTFTSLARAVALFDHAGVLLSLTPVLDQVSDGGPVSIAIAPDGTIAIAGNYSSWGTFRMASGALPVTSAGWTDAFVACLPAGGSGLAWVRQGRGTLQEQNTAIAFTADGNILSGGNTRMGLDFEVGDGTTLRVPGDENGFLVEIVR